MFRTFPAGFMGFFKKVTESVISSRKCRKVKKVSFLPVLTGKSRKKGGNSGTFLRKMSRKEQKCQKLMSGDPLKPAGK